MKVEMISKEVITPSNPTPKHLNLLKLSLLDEINSPILMPLIFFYSQNHNINNNVSINTMLNRLKRSLATTLTKFYPLAGRIKDDNDNYVLCNDEGVLYTQTRVDCRVIDVVHKANVSELDKLLPLISDNNNTLLRSPSKLPCAIQINVFKSGGIAIGLRVNHKFSDVFSLLMFVKTWSIVARGESTYLLPSFDVAKRFPLSTKRASTYEFESEDVVSKRFMFDEIGIRSIKTKYNIGSNGKVSFGLVLLAFVYSRIVATSHSNKVPYEVSEAINVRSKIEPAPKDYFYFGNFYLDSIVKPSLTGEIFYEMVEQIRKARMKIDSNFMAKVQNGTQDLSYITDRFERAKKGKVVTLGFSNYNGLPVYESDFGWGGPVWVTSATLPMTNVVIFLPTQCSKIVEVYINLNKNDMKNLECDHEFVSVATKTLSSKM